MRKFEISDTSLLNLNNQASREIDKYKGQHVSLAFKKNKQLMNLQAHIKSGGIDHTNRQRQYEDLKDLKTREATQMNLLNKGLQNN